MPYYLHLYTMINNKEFTIRLEEIFDHYSINAAGFAEKIGIGRSSVSHIVSGRNKPSLDFVMHILEHFPDITFEWLVYGKGNLDSKKQNSENVIFENKQEIDADTKFSNSSPNLFNISEKTSSNLKSTENIHSSINNKSIEVDCITIFYKDGTFKNYTPK